MFDKKRTLELVKHAHTIYILNVSVLVKPINSKVVQVAISNHDS